MIVQPFPSFFPLGTMACSCSQLRLTFLQFVVTMFRFEYVYSYAPARPPRVSVTTFTSYICCIYTSKFGQYRTLFCKLIPFEMPYMQFLFVRPRLCPQGHFSVPTSDFLQIPPRGGHPCLRLTVPTAKSVADFHRQVIAHVERTRKRDSLTGEVGLPLF